MAPERPHIPDWARYEREADLEWIEENQESFWTTATAAFETIGRGVIVVDTTTQPDPQSGHPFGYFPQEQVETYDDEDVTRIASEYDPEAEFVVVLLKPEDRTSTYRVCVRPPEPEPAPKRKLKPPSIETLIAWEEDGGCEAACEYGCWVEPDGRCEHGRPSWLIVMGLI